MSALIFKHCQWHCVWIWRRQLRN